MTRTREELDELKQKLIEFRAQGLSETEMGERLGLTKAQVSGHINRMIRGYRDPKQYAAKKAAEASAPAEFVPPTSGPRPKPSHPTTLAELPIVKTALSFEPLPGKVSVWNVKRGQCRWVDDEGFFCADPTIAPTKSYCKTHHQICFYKLTPKVKTACHNSLPSPSVNFA